MGVGVVRDEKGELSELCGGWCRRFEEDEERFVPFSFGTLLFSPFYTLLIPLAPLALETVC